MTFTNPSGKRGVVSTSKKKCATTGKEAVIRVLLNSIKEPKLLPTILFSNNCSDADSNLSDLSIRDINKQRSQEIRQSIFN